YLRFVRAHESSRLRQLWLRKEHVCTAVAAREGLAHLDSDSIVWGFGEPGKIAPGKIPVQRPDEAAAASFRTFIDSRAAWVIEGCYGELVRAASAHCTLLVFLNPGIDACLVNNLKLPWESHKYASLELQNSMLAQRQKWVTQYYQRTDPCSHQVHREIF